MKKYPTINGPDRNVLGQECTAFYKYDGSNLRFEWMPKKGWFAQGTRHRAFTKNDPVYGPAIKIFQEQLAPHLNGIIKNHWPRCEEVVAFCEYFGPNSFAGQHTVPDLCKMGFNVQHNEPMCLVLIDLNIHKKGLVDPHTFCNFFVEKMPKDLVAQPVYHGELNTAFVNAVFSGDFEEKKGIRLHEGVVCKGGEGHNLWMAKVKTKIYHGLLKLHLPNEWREHWDWEM